MSRVWKVSFMLLVVYLLCRDCAPNDETELFCDNILKLGISWCSQIPLTKAMCKSIDIYFMVSNALQNHTCQQNRSNIDGFSSHKIQRSILFSLVQRCTDFNECFKVSDELFMFHHFQQVRRKVYWLNKKKKKKKNWILMTVLVLISAQWL